MIRENRIQAAKPFRRQNKAPPRNQNEDLKTTRIKISLHHPTAFVWCRSKPTKVSAVREGVVYPVEKGGPLETVSGGVPLLLVPREEKVIHFRK